MEHDNSHGVGGPAVFTGGVGTFDTADAERTAPTSTLFQISTSPLRALYEQLQEGGHTLARYCSMNLEQLEMLEAELRNQGLTPGDTGETTSIAQHAAHYVTILGWRAARVGLVPPCIDFRVNLPQYIIARAEEISRALESQARDEDLLLRRTDSWGRERETRTQMLQQAEYLGRLAGFLLSSHEQHTNRYQRGLSLVLRTLSSSASERDPAVRNGMEIVLPITVSAFLEKVRNGTPCESST